MKIEYGKREMEIKKSMVASTWKLSSVFIKIWQILIRNIHPSNKTVLCAVVLVSDENGELFASKWKPSLKFIKIWQILMWNIQPCNPAVLSADVLVSDQLTRGL